MSTSDLQFGFKSGGSTNSCTFMLKETISYYLKSGNCVNAAFLDATKAFDRVNYCKLFDLLIKRNVPPCVLRLILTMYVDQFMCVKWNSAISERFDISNGVKQGGVLSPVLFCVYIDGLLCKLKQSGLGCNVGNIYCGAFGYADDLALLSPSVCGLQKLVDICRNYAAEFDISFNCKKSKMMVFSKGHSSHKPTVMLNFERLEYVSEFVHLGHVLRSDLSDNNDIMSQRAKFVGKANAIISDFKGTAGMLKYGILKTYCYNFYGCQLWNLQDQTMDKLCVSWRKACRKSIGLPDRTHNKLLPIICNTTPFLSILEKRFIRFFMSCVNSSNSNVRFIAQYASYDCHSATGQNLNSIFCKYGISLYKLYNSSYSEVAKYIDDFYRNRSSAIDKAHASVIRECINSRDSLCNNVLSGNDCSRVADYLCTV